MTAVRILDYDSTEYINFEAEISYAETEGVMQIEFFGAHVSSEGEVCYGLRVESIMERVESGLSLDLMSRFLADVHGDTSTLLDSLLSSYQRGLLDVVFHSHAQHRDKFNVIFADAITPRVAADQYMDKEDKENELKQVLGQTRSAHDLPDGSLVILGAHGILLAGKESVRHERVVCSFLQLQSLNIFLKNFFTRLLVLDAQLKETRMLIDKWEQTPNSIPAIRHHLSTASADVVLLSDLLSFLAETLAALSVAPTPPLSVSYNHYKAPPGVPEPTPEQIERQKELDACVKLCELLDLQTLKQNLQRRTQDMAKNIEGARHTLNGLREMTDVISETQMFKVQEALQANTKNLEDVFRSNERASSSLEVMQVILSGTLAFDILDRLVGEWSVADTEWAASWIIEPLIKQRPGLWFLVNMMLWGLIALGLISLMRHLTASAHGVLTLRYKVNCQINLENLRLFLETKVIDEEDFDRADGTLIHKLSWTEREEEEESDGAGVSAGVWGGSPPRVEILVDEQNSFLLRIYMHIEKGSRLSSSMSSSHLTILLRELTSRSVIDSKTMQHLITTLSPNH
eukprot:TRINITY_DN11949_c0_g1_i1.p1 TRINITY_DN11949_c0_g1~~TRINITY_DN11949_c0_g1_i1.p1  ORF type:complete len:646 (-),score=157.07 TRINITY_DN11949_c0_g1_i1:101-1819(-)